MNILITNFMTPEYADYNYQSLKWWNCKIPNCKYYIVSEICENWPFDYNISRLKNKCLDVAKKLKPDWMIMMPGIDSALQNAPDFTSLDKNKFYWGYKFNQRLENKEPCSIHLYSDVIYNNYRYDEKHKFYYDDYDFFYLKTKQIEKENLQSLICTHLDHNSLIRKNNLIQESYNSSRNIFENDYMKEFNINFACKIS